MTSQIGTHIATLLKAAALRTGITLQNFSPETADGEDALEVAEIKAYFSSDSAVCIRKPLIRWKGWKKQEGSLHLFKELSAVTSE